ncbi:MAG: tetratricopeptide repeat protein [Chitinophagaceae bacterium]|nr:tetratricopeptide repeat protein [Chitinophagaceae bacterium]
MMARWILVVACWTTASFGNAQVLPPDWQETLQQAQPGEGKRLWQLYELMIALPRPQRMAVLDTLAMLSRKAPDHRAVRATVLHSMVAPKLACDSALPNLLQASNTATALQNEELLAACYYALADKYSRCGPNEKAVFYFLKTWELRQQTGTQLYAGNAELLRRLGDLFFRIEEYERCIGFVKQALQSNEPRPTDGRLYAMPNLIAMSYQRLQQYNDAKAWYDTAMLWAQQRGNADWQAIVGGNLGHLYLQQQRYDAALPLLQTDFEQAMRRGDVPSAGNTLQRIAAIDLAEGRLPQAEARARTAYELTTRAAGYYQPQYPMAAAYTLAQVLAARQQHAAAAPYWQHYQRLKDSLQAVLSRSRYDVVQTELAFEKTKLQRNELLAAQQAERQKRYLLLTGLLLTAVLGYAVYQRKKHQQAMLQQQLAQQTLLANAAADQLAEYMQHVVEKTELIEKLERQMQPLQPTELISQTILTEEDWLRFRAMFDRVYPLFFERLQQLAPEATPADLRMAALVKLGVGNKHIASMLGVSADTVRKSKSRLRQRLPVSATQDLDQLISQL